MEIFVGACLGPIEGAVFPIGFAVFGGGGGVVV